MTINVLNPYTAKIAALSIPLASVISPLMERGMSLDEVAEHLRVACIALDAEQVRKGKISVNELRERLGYEPLPLTDEYLEGIIEMTA